MSTSAAKRIFVTVAEVSGDQHAAQLVRCLKELNPTLTIEGHGGRNLREAGAIVHQDTTTRAAMMTAAAGRAIEIWRLLRWTRRHFGDHPPDLHICVDSWSMNYHFAKLAKRRGARVLYYIAPQTWASREGRLRKMRRVIDQIACILPFEQEYFRRHGLNATYVGHPLFDELPANRAWMQQAPLAGRAPVVGLLAGSREPVARQNFPRLLAVAQRIRQVFADCTFHIPTTPATDAIIRTLSGALRGVTIKQDAFNHLVAACDLCLSVSGTAALQTAALGVPMIVVYYGNPILWHLIARWIIKTRTYSLVNLLSDAHEHIVPEFIPWYGSIDPVAQAAIELLREPDRLDQQRQHLHHLIRSLNKPGASMNAAKLAMDMLNG